MNGKKIFFNKIHKNLLTYIPDNSIVLIETKIKINPKVDKNMKNITRPLIAVALSFSMIIGGGSIANAEPSVNEAINASVIDNEDYLGGINIPGLPNIVIPPSIVNMINVIASVAGVVAVAGLLAALSGGGNSNSSAIDSNLHSIADQIGGAGNHEMSPARANEIISRDLRNARASRGLPSVRSDANLRNSAQRWAENLRDNNFCGHERGYGQEFEVITCTSLNGPEGAIDGWLNSPDHKRVILHNDVRSFGVGAAFNKSNNMWYMVIKFDR